MSRKSRTTLYLRVKLPLPPGANIPMIIAFVKNAIETKQETDRSLAPEATMAGLQTNEITISLEKRETVYF